MEKAAIPTDDTARLRTLHGLQLLDTADEQRFDRITRLAARMFNVPIALVSLLDTNRQWFKSRHGLATRETGRDESFCGHAILFERPFVIPDALADARFADNPLVTDEPHVRFYAGYPVHAPNGMRVGTLCLIDRVPREFPDSDVAALVDLAGMVDRELALSVTATVDELTQLCNRRGFMASADKTLAHCRRGKLPAALAIFDLNSFKVINDTLGHAAGDEVLRSFAALLLKHFRQTDVVARLSGDEFAVLASGATESALANTLNRFSERFMHSELAQRHRDLSWSAGIVELDAASNQTLDQLLNMADERMYDAKEAHHAVRRSALG